MFRKISADIIYPITSSPLKEGVIILDETGKIVEITTRQKFDTSEIEIYEGAITPGFINAHCHLELSHLKGVAQTGTGLIDFISQVIKNRNHSKEIIQEAIEREERNMIQSGIVAIGDISNTTDTFYQKQKEQLYYYTFVEYFDLFQEENTLKTIEQYDAVFNQLKKTKKNQKSKVPHAPYSVSEKLFNSFQFAEQHKTISIHNQETLAENELFERKKGGFIDFYNKIGVNTDAIPMLQKTSIFYALNYLEKQHKSLFVHNTLTTQQEIDFTHQQLGKNAVFWATCPNANLYIENRLPNYKAFLQADATVCIGTDSLTSNWQLNILEEMKTILKYCSYLDFEAVLKWATINGAKALGFEENLGSLEIGKNPGLVLIENFENGILTQETTSRKI